jgi:hypothetical protein
MKPVKATQDEMSRRMARFKELKSYQYQNEAANGIPAEVTEKIAAQRVNPLDGIGIRFDAGVER